MSSEVQAKCTNRRRARLPNARQTLLQPVFDRLDVVVGFDLDRLRLRGVLLRESFDDPLELGVGRLRERLDVGDRRLGGERQEPADLDRDAVAEKAPTR